MSLLELFCNVDDFCNAFDDYLQACGLAAGSDQKRGPQPLLALSEVMTIIIHYHQSHYRDFKAYYTDHVSMHLRSEFRACPATIDSLS